MDITKFSYSGQQVRTVTSDSGETLFVGKDVALILGYVNPTKAIRDHCKGGPKRYPLQTTGGVQNLRVITEPDIYRLITNSKLPTAQKFEAWVFEEVLPTIRKTGSYKTTNQKPASLLPVDKEFRAAVRMAKAAGLKGNMAILSANRLTVKMTGTDCLQLLDATHLISEAQERYLTPTEIKDMVDLKSAQAVNKALKAAGLQEKNGKHWSPTDAGEEYAILMDTGKKHSDGSMVQQIKWKESVIKLIMSEATA